MKITNHIESKPSVMLGKPIIKGTRITVELILNKLAGGYSVKEIPEMYPTVNKGDVMACLTYAALMVGDEKMIKAA